MSQSVPAYPKSGYTASQKQLLCQFLVTQTNIYVTLLFLGTFLVISDPESVNQLVIIFQLCLVNVTQARCVL
ncbi:MAG: hypothetical protein ACYDDR_14590, partial [Acidithiobacillus ferrivorans]